MERILQAMIGQNIALPSHKKPFIYFIPLGEDAKGAAFRFSTLCRHQGIPAEIELHAQKLQTALQNAVQSEAVYCAILGSHELEKQKMQLKHLETREVQEVPFDDLITAIVKAFAHV